jgi:F-type H+-transporting ATPase subunit b
VKAAAEAESAKAREAAMAEAELERGRILGDLRGQVAALAIAAANNWWVTLDEKKQRALIDEFFSGVKSGKVVVVGEDLKGDAAVVTSALPLTNDEQAAVKKSISAKELLLQGRPFHSRWSGHQGRRQGA